MEKKLKKFPEPPVGKYDVAKETIASAVQSKKSSKKDKRKQANE